MADGKVVIDVILEDGTVAKGVANIDKKLGGLRGSSERAAFSIGKIVTALGLVALAGKAIDTVRNALDGAIERYDTLNNFPRVLQQMGFDAGESSRAIQRLSDGIQGLPTTLDDVAKTAQRIAILTGDLDGAVETTLALNNAFISSGSSSADARRGLEQYVQMLSKGEVDLQSWKTLQETMGVALNETAKAFGFVGASAQNELYDALRDGEITFAQFNAKIIELSNAQDGFAERALTASGGIRTAWTNMRTAVVRGVTTILEAIDRVLEDTPYESIEGIISRIGQVLNFMLVQFANNIPVIAQKMMELKDRAVEIYNALEPWLPLIKNVLIALGGLTVTVAAVNTLHNAFLSVRAAIMAVQASFLVLGNAIRIVNAALLMNPIGLVIAAIIAAVALIYYYWEPIKDFFIKLWDGIRSATTNAWNGIKNFFTKTLANILNAVKRLFSDSVNAVKTKMNNTKEVIQDAFQWVLDFILGLGIKFFDAGKNIVTSIADGIKSAINKVTDAIGDITAKVRDYLPFSPAKEGPLRDLNKLDFGGPIQDSLKASLPDVQKVLSNLLTIEPRLSASTAAGGGTSTTNNYQSFGDINLDAKDLRHIADLIDMFNSLRQTSRQGV